MDPARRDREHSSIGCNCALVLSQARLGSCAEDQIVAVVRLPLEKRPELLLGLRIRTLLDERADVVGPGRAVVGRNCQYLFKQTRCLIELLTLVSDSAEQSQRLRV